MIGTDLTDSQVNPDASDKNISPSRPGVCGTGILARGELRRRRRCRSKGG